jgi:hypothetical protein
LRPTEANATVEPVEPRRASDSALWSLPSWSSPRDVSSWFDETAWWTSPSFARTPNRALVELLEAVAGRFTDRELSLQFRTHAVRLRVDAVQVRGRPDPSAVDDPFRWVVERSGVSDLVRWGRGVIGFGAGQAAPPVEAVEFDASEVHVDDLFVGNVEVRVDGMRLDAGVPYPEVVTGPIELEVRTTRGRVIEWLRRAYPAWDLQLRPDGLVALSVPGRRWRMLVRPTVDAHTLRTEIVGVLVLRRAVRLPRFLVRTRVDALPPLDPSVELLDVQIAGDDVTLRVRHDGLRQTVRLDALRAAVREGATKLGDVIFGGQDRAAQ